MQEQPTDSIFQHFRVVRTLTPDNEPFRWGDYVCLLYHERIGAEGIKEMLTLLRDPNFRFTPDNCDPVWLEADMRILRAACERTAEKDFGIPSMIDAEMRALIKEQEWKSDPTNLLKAIGIESFNYLDGDCVTFDAPDDPAAIISSLRAYGFRAQIYVDTREKFYEPDAARTTEAVS